MSVALVISAAVDLSQPNKPINLTLYSRSEDITLSSAIMGENLPVIQGLLCQPKIEIKPWNTQYQPPIQAALEYQRHDILKIFLQDPRTDICIQNGRGYTALHLAIIYDDLVALKMILDHPRIDINHVDRAGSSPLLLAAMTYDGLSSKRDAILDILVSHPEVLVNMQDRKGRSVLWHAANTGNERLILQLMRLPDLELEVPDVNGVTPLEQARKRGHLEIVANLESLATF